MNKKVQAIVIVTSLLLLSSKSSAINESWSCYGHTTTRHSIALDGPDTIDGTTFEWISWNEPNQDFSGPSCPAVFDDKVYVHAFACHGDPNVDPWQEELVAFDATTGDYLWGQPVDPIPASFTSDSWSSPCVDPRNGNVLIGSGYKVHAFDGDSGTELWTATLQDPVINASVCLASDLEPARAFITDFDLAFARIYCINLDPNVPENPYEPGEIIWTDTIGAASGNTPAYKDGVVYFANRKIMFGPGGTYDQGVIHAYDATATTPVELWETTDPNFLDGFYGGITITKAGYLYAATFAFGAGENIAKLCKLDIDNGSIIWITDCETTDSVPIVVGDKIYLSGGMSAYGRPKIQAFQDYGSTVSLLWETPSSLPIGCWTYQPVYANKKLYVGATSPDYELYPFEELYILDTTLSPEDPGFVISQFTSGCGSSPAVTIDAIYASGVNGLHKFYQPALVADIDGGGSVGAGDLADMAENWLYDGAIGIKRSDLDLDGKVNLIDFSALSATWLDQL